MAEKNLLTGHTKGEKKKRKASTYFFMCFVMTRKKKKRRLCVCMCVERENFCRRRSRVRERAKGNRCDVMKAVVLQR
jgi:hypothetical protein